MNDAERVRWARALTTAGWLFVFAYLGLITAQIRLAFVIESSSFEGGVWGARIERIAFVAFPQNVLILLPAAAAGTIATILGRGLVDLVETWTTQLVRIVAGICYVVIAIAAIRVAMLLGNNPDAVGDFAAIIRQLGGILISIAIVRVCLEAERSV